MPIQKITGPEGSEMTGFVIVDLDGAQGADGVVRCAKKILMDGARTMARSRTYSWALLEQQRSGASAAVNAPPPQRSEGIAAFVDAVLPRVQAGELSLDAAKGVAPAELSELHAADTRPSLEPVPGARGSAHEDLTAAGVVAAAVAALDGLDGATVAIEGAGALGPTLIDHLAAAGARVVGIGTASGTVADPAGLDPATVADSWAEHGDALPAASGSELDAAAVLGLEADALLCGSKLGLVDHDVAGRLSVRALVPIGVAPVTAKGLAVAARGGTLVLADFLTLSGALHATVADTTDTATLVQQVRERTTELSARALAHAEGPYLGACAAAEQFLSSWLDELPFGRPLA